MATLALLAAPHPLRADESLPQLGLGSHVRITAPSAFKGTLEGRVKAVGETSIDLLSDDQATISVPKAAVTQLQVSFGRKGHARQGALIGAAIGALPFIVTCGDSSDYCGAGLIVAGAAVWGGIGALIGNLFHSDTWVVVPIAGPRVGVNRATQRGYGFAVRISF